MKFWTPADGEKDPNKTYFKHAINPSRTAVFDIPSEKFGKRMEAWANGNGLIQDVFPELSADEREYILTGISPEEWDSMFSDED